MARTASAARPSAAPTESATARGRRAEALVQRWLEARGWVVVARNLRVGRDELDLVAWDGATLVVIEVRSARVGAMVDPCETLSLAKRARLRAATLRYAQSIDARDVRVDFVAVRGDEVEHFASVIEFGDG